MAANSSYHCAGSESPPALSGQISRAVSQSERGLYMGVQQAFGGASRVVFPIGVGVAIDHLGQGLPFFVSAGLVLAALALTVSPRTTSLLVEPFATAES